MEVALVACAHVRPTSQMSAAVGSSGRMPSVVDPIVTGTWCTASHDAATAANTPVRSLLAATSVTRTTAVASAKVSTVGRAATTSSVRACEVPG